MDYSFSLDVTGCGGAPTTPLPFSGVSPAGETIGVNSRYFTYNGRPFIPVMGEIHFSRYPEEYWEEALLRMKAGGIGIAATYVFWIHHEEEEGNFRTDGNLNLRKFIGLCKKHGLLFMLRIGPWCHGECRNGGLPDWLLQKGFPIRENNEGYLCAVRGFFSKIHSETDGLYFEQGGPIIGVQIENEYGHAGGLTGEAGKKHMRLLKQIAVEEGICVPFYTATAWGGGIVVDGEMLPVLGGYVEAPWEQSDKELPPNPNYLFASFQNDTGIASDFRTADGKGFTCTIEAYPYATAELGGGIMPTAHRRPVVTGEDTEAMILAKLGSGVNLIGYYMYHGGTNPAGKYTTLQESRATGYANDYPEFSYDFQAPLGEYGSPSPAFYRLRPLHLFLQDFGGKLAAMPALIPPENPATPADTGSPRLSVRADGKSGFLFANNYQRHLSMPPKTYRAAVHTSAGTVEFDPFTLPDGGLAIFPFHLELGSVWIRWATAQPLCTVQRPDGLHAFFFEVEGTAPVFVLESGQRIVPEDGKPLCVKIEDVTVHCISRSKAMRAARTGGTIVFADGLLAGTDGRAILTAQTSTVQLEMLPGQLPLADGAECTYAGFDRGSGLEQYTVAFTPVSCALNLAESAPKGDKRVFFLSFDSNHDGLNDLFLTIRWAGESARLYLDGELIADSFYTGLPWRIGLKRFVGRLQGRPLTLEITPLYKEDPIFFDLPPAFDEGKACEVFEAVLQPEYTCDLTINELEDSLWQNTL